MVESLSLNLNGIACRKQFDKLTIVGKLLDVGLMNNIDAVFFACLICNEFQTIFHINNCFYGIFTVAEALEAGFLRQVVFLVLFLDLLVKNLRESSKKLCFVDALVIGNN